MSARGGVAVKAKRAKMSQDERAAELEKVIAALPLEPPAGTAEMLAERGYFGDVLIYRVGYIIDPLTEMRRKMCLCHCTACGKETYLDYKSLDDGCGCQLRYSIDKVGFNDPADEETKTTGDSCICPNCGAGVKALHIARIRGKKEICSAVATALYNVCGHLTVLTYDIAKYTDKDGIISYCPRLWDGTVIIDGKMFRAAGHYNKFGSIVYLPRWETRKRYDDYIGGIAADTVITASADCIGATDSAKSALGEYIQSGARGSYIYPTYYLRLWCTHPNAENLIRAGFAGLITDIIKSGTGYYQSYESKTFDVKSTDKYIDWKKAKPAEMLRLTKNELYIARKYNLYTINFYTLIRDGYGIRLTDELLDKVQAIADRDLISFIGTVQHGYYPPVVRTINYIYKQITESRCKLVDSDYLRDYRDMLFKVYGSMPEELLYPRDLRRAHDEMALKIKEKEDAALNERITAALAERAYLAWRDDALGLFIRPCGSHAELIKEGKILHHCVATYAKAHASGVTTILFIRRTEDPDMPYFTLEYKNGCVQQNRGDHNCERTPEVAEFEKKWLKVIKKKELKNGKRVDGEKDSRAGA